MTIFLIAGLLAARSPAAWLGFLAETILMALFQWRKPLVWKGILLGLIAFLLALLFIPSLKQKVISAPNPPLEEIRETRVLHETTLKMWEANKLWGVGPGGFASHFREAQSKAGQPELGKSHPNPFHGVNGYWDWLAERGLAGMALGGLLVAALLRKRWKNLESPERGLAAAVELTLLFGIGIVSLFSSPLSEVPVACVLALLFNPGWGMSRGTDQTPSLYWTEGRFGLGLVLLVFCGMGVSLAYQNARLHRGILEGHSQQYESALKTLDFDPANRLLHYTDPRVYREKAAVLIALGRDDEAIEVTKELIRVNPYDADAYAELCKLNGMGRSWDLAEEAGEKALNLDPFHEEALGNMGLVSYFQGQKKRALDYWTRLEQVQAARGEDQKAAETRQKISALSHSRH
ncbi:MAG TPA: O-antigen ligase family protein [bacterium]|nr:O-antigen ligase family protein [bacterium]